MTDIRCVPSIRVIHHEVVEPMSIFQVLYSLRLVIDSGIGQNNSNKQTKERKKEKERTAEEKKSKYDQKRHRLVCGKLLQKDDPARITQKLKNRSNLEPS